MFVQQNYPQDSLNVFLTHLAMALQRNKNGDYVNQMETFMKEEIENQPQYLKVVELANQVVSKLNLFLADSEFDYLLLHLCNLIKEG